MYYGIHFKFDFLEINLFIILLFNQVKDKEIITCRNTSPEIDYNVHRFLQLKYISFLFFQLENTEFHYVEMDVSPLKASITNYGDSNSINSSIPNTSSNNIDLKKKVRQCEMPSCVTHLSYISQNIPTSKSPFPVFCQKKKITPFPGAFQQLETTGSIPHMRVASSTPSEYPPWRQVFRPHFAPKLPRFPCFATSERTSVISNNQPVPALLLSSP